MPPAAVEVVEVQTQAIVDALQTNGNLKSRQGVMLRPEVSGRVAQLNFTDGAGVRKGQTLIQLDDALQQAQLKQAQAEMAIADANHKRNLDLFTKGFVSQRGVDESAANLQVAQAKLGLAQAQVLRMKIVAPFDGVVGIRAVNLGDYVKDGADLVNIEDVSQILLDFSLPERIQAKVKKGLMVKVSVDALPGKTFEGEVEALNPLMDSNGRSLQVRARLDNKAALLRPGMFARISLIFGERDKSLVVPEEAIVPLQGKQFVLQVVDDANSPSGKISQRREVKLGARQLGKVEILEGLSAGMQVVTAGQQRLQKDGSPVRVIAGDKK